MVALALAGIVLAWRNQPFEALRYAGVLFLFPAIYYFSHPEPYDMRPLDPLLLLLGSFAVLTLRERAGAEIQSAAETTHDRNVVYPEPDSVPEVS